MIYDPEDVEVTFAGQIVKPVSEEALNFETLNYKEPTPEFITFDVIPGTSTATRLLALAERGAMFPVSGKMKDTQKSFDFYGKIERLPDRDGNLRFKVVNIKD